jgi:multidrug efflux pump subunit AcrB
MLNKTVTKKTITLPLLLAFCACTYFLSNSLPSGFIPAEDQGMIYAIIQTPPGSTLERTNQIARELLRESEDIDGVQSVSSLAGYEILTEGTGSNSELVLLTLKAGTSVKNLLRKSLRNWKKKPKIFQGPISNSSSRLPFPDMELQEVSNSVYWIKPVVEIITKWNR